MEFWTGSDFSLAVLDSLLLTCTCPLALLQLRGLEHSKFKVFVYAVFLFWNV
jgi:hypothetical protein